MDQLLEDKFSILVKQNKLLKEELRRIHHAINSIYIDNIQDAANFIIEYNLAVEALLSFLTKEQLQTFKEHYPNEYSLLDSIFLFDLKKGKEDE